MKFFPAVLLVVGLVLTGCSGGGTSSGPDTGAEVTARPTPATAHPGGVVVRIRIQGDDVDPSGSRVDARAGEPVTLLITASAAGELHVHSTPEQQVSFPAGTSAATLRLREPGVVDVEDHALDKLIVQLEVR